MWTCGEVKKDSRTNLKRSLWTAVLLTLILFLISGIISGPQNVINVIRARLQYGDLRSVFSSSNFVNEAASSPAVIILGLLQSTLSLLSLAATFFLINPILVGYSKWFLVNRRPEETAEINLLFSSFKRDSYVGILSGTAWVTLWTMIWSFVAGFCFIPLGGVVIAGIFSVVFSAGSYSGSNVSITQSEFLDRLRNIAPAFIIVFAVVFLLGLAGYLAIMLNRKYAYFFTSFILAENPAAGAKNALDLSKRMTQGMKGKLFLLDLSFIGWWLLSFITCGILSLGIKPYVYAAYTEVYCRRKVEQNI